MRTRKLCMLVLSAALLFGCTKSAPVKEEITSFVGVDELTSDEKFYLNSFDGDLIAYDAAWDDEQIDTVMLNIYRFMDGSWQKKESFTNTVGGKNKCKFILGTDIVDFKYAIQAYDDSKYSQGKQTDLSPVVGAHDWANTTGNYQSLKTEEPLTIDKEIPVLAIMRYNADGQNDKQPNPLLAQFDNTESIDIHDDLEYYMITVIFTSEK